MRRIGIMYIAAVLYLASMFLYKIDPEFHLRWIVFAYWIVSVLLMVLLLLPTSWFSRLRWKNFTTFPARITSTFRNISLRSLISQTFAQIDWVFIVVVVLFSAVGLFAITVYPYHTIGDELRDGGLNAMQLVTGEIKNIFAWGRYESHGLIIPTYSALFYLIFKNSPLTFKLAAFSIALVGVATLYIWGRRSHSRGFAALLVAILCSIPHFLYYARTEVVVIFSTFWMIFILFIAWEWLKKREWQSFVAICAVLGFAAGFHGSTRTIVLFTGLLLGGIFIVSELMAKKTALWRLCLFVIVAAFAFMLGFGPRLFNTTPEIAVMSRSLFTKEVENKAEREEKTLTLQEKITTSVVSLGEKYKKSLMVYVYEPTTTHFAGKVSILPFAAIITVVVGIYACLVNKDRRYLLIVFYFFLIPLTNSALTEVTNGDHRYGPIYPIAAIVATIGIAFLFKEAEKLSAKRKLFTQGGLIFFVILFHGWSFLSFFVTQPASVSMFRLDSRVYQDFMFTDSLALISEQRLDRYGKVCFTTNKRNADFLDKMHIKEQVQYYLPGVKYQIVTNPDLDDHSLYISTDCDTPFEEVVWEERRFCEQKTWFTCPPDGSQYVLYYSVP
ncbi:MAG: hypothetical protein QY314_02545 [Candidatus Dojkabacteria bacterium]|nr:MAG: hypothetical protein QY314_02545 [Candidatus Dojkabacteria bacterium]